MQFKRKLYYSLSPEQRLTIRKLYYLPIDIWNSITGQRHKYEPLKGDTYIGSGDFIETGLAHLNLLKKQLDLQAEDAVLDIGSGIGRTAVALTGYLNSNGSYEGFDVVEKGVKWCNQRIKNDYPNFNFTYVPLKNDLYNKHIEEAQKFAFPYSDDSFDKVFLFSVFTHMSVAEIAHYLREIKRVLIPGGLCLATFLIYSDKNEEKISRNKHFSFPIKKEGYRLMSHSVQSANICLHDTFLDKLIDWAELIKVKTLEGSWKGNGSGCQDNLYQDIVIIKA